MKKIMKLDYANLLIPEVPETEKNADWYIENWCEKAGIDADKLFEVCKSMPRHREQSMYSGKSMVNKKTGEPIFKRIVGIGSFSISPNKRGLKDGVVNPHARSLEEAPPEIIHLADELTKLNKGKPVNY